MAVRGYWLGPLRVFLLILVLVLLMDNASGCRRRRRCSRVNCAVSGWSYWSSCSNGVTRRTRRITRYASCGGSSCPHLEESKCCPVDCVFGSWGSWGSCTTDSAGRKRKYRSRSFVKYAKCGGRCDGSTTDSACCPVNCVMGNWGSWGQCVNKIKFRYRQVNTYPSCGGTLCGPTTEVDTCCTPVDCTWGNWGSWDTCPSDGGVQRRTRSKAIRDECGGTCTGSSEETRTCACTRKNCIWGAWGAWAECNSENKQSRTRTKTQTESCSGTCSGAATEIQTCFPNQCGLRQVQVASTASIGIAFGTPQISPAIVGGRDVDTPGSHPWVISLQTNGTHFCGGTLISDTGFITAAHCTDKHPVNEVEVVLGGHDLQNPDSNIQRRNVVQFVVHPDYSLQKSPFSIKNDIALGQMDSAVTFNSRVWPACLTTDRTGVSDCTIVGWGAQDSSGGGTGSILQETPATIESEQACQDSFGDFKCTTADGCICVDPDASSMMCGGDSGGPMVCKAAESGQYALMGVASFTYSDCSLTAGINGGLMDVTHFMPWISQYGCSPEDCVWDAWGQWAACASDGTQTRTRSKQTVESCGGTCSASASESRTCIPGTCGVRQVELASASSSGPHGGIGIAFGPIGPAIVGGKTVDPPGKWPSMGSIQKKSDGSHLCGATLISSRFLITAAHCYSNNLALQVVVGGHDLKNPDSNIQIVDVAQIIKHPDYKMVTGTSFSIAHDIAVVELASPVTFNSQVQPACLIEDTSNVKDCYIVGWGAQSASYIDNGVGGLLQETGTARAIQSDCEQAFGTWTTPNGIICVDPAGSAQICGGDSGGPMLCTAAESGQFALVGVVSFAYRECKETHGINGGLADTAKYVPWIRTACGGCV